MNALPRPDMTQGSEPGPVPRVIAFHLPQFHRIPENDAWWGEGFTEWTNVRKARPLYASHRQPSVPLAGNYYDLTNPATRDWQAKLARQYGVHGFCYYHYWFNGKRLLERPCDEILASGQPDFPFCFSWANESWTRAWDGAQRNVLMQQDYGDELAWKRHFQHLLHYFRDPRYLTHRGKPMFLIYRPGDFPERNQMMMCWERWAQEAGLPGVCFIKTLTCFDAVAEGSPYSAAVSFEPWLTVRRHTSFSHRAACLLARGILRTGRFLGVERKFVYSYDRVWRDLLARRHGPDDFPGAFVGWDNTPRRGWESMIVDGGTPEKFGVYFRQLLQGAVRDGAPYVFVNAWNEWAEGAYLEPDERYGYAYLENLKEAIEKELGDG